MIDDTVDQNLYSFDVNFQAGEYAVLVDSAERYGCFEHNTEGSDSAGGLWFDDDGLTLLDYDGVFELPEAVVVGLREHGFTVGADFEPDSMIERQSRPSALR